MRGNATRVDALEWVGRYDLLGADCGISKGQTKTGVGVRIADQKYLRVELCTDVLQVCRDNDCADVGSPLELANTRRRTQRATTKV